MGELIRSFQQNFIDGNRWQFYLTGLGNTVIIAFFAVVIGFSFGFLMAAVRVTYEREGKLRFLNILCKIYLTVIRGTPVLVQLLILYFVILISVNNKIVVAIVAFGFNSAAYMAEVLRSGIMSIDIGQFEAGRSLGMNYSQTMGRIILPQAFKNVLPALGNEFITLLKETSVSGFIGLMDLTRAGDIVRSQTYSAFLPLFGVAVIYLILVMLLQLGVNSLERRMRVSER